MVARVMEESEARDGKLRVWGFHCRARMEGCPKEDLSRESTVLKEAGDNIAEAAALKILHPRLTEDEAREAMKYGPPARCRPVSYQLPEIAQLEREVSQATMKVGVELWERFAYEELGVTDWSDLPSSYWQARLQSVQGVRYLVRQVYVLGTKVRQWPGSSFDWVYPYAIKENRKDRHGREVTVRLVCERLGE